MPRSSWTRRGSDGTPNSAGDHPARDQRRGVARDGGGSGGRGVQRCTAPAASEIQFYSSADLLGLPDPEFLVEPYLVEQALTVLFGASGTYKTFNALDWAARAPGLAIYVSAEGAPKHMGRRIEAWEQTNGRASGVLVRTAMINLFTGEGVPEFMAAARGAAAPGQSDGVRHPAPGAAPGLTRTALRTPG